MPDAPWDRDVANLPDPIGELARLAAFVDQRGIAPVIDRAMPLAEARDGFAAMVDGDVFGKVVFAVG